MILFYSGGVGGNAGIFDRLADGEVVERAPGGGLRREPEDGVNLVVDWILSINSRPSGASAEM